MSKKTPEEAPTALTTKFSRLFQDGKLLHIHTPIWSMQVRLSAEDLPLEEGVELPEFVRLGNKMLIDDTQLKKFKVIEKRARNYLAQNSYPFPIAQAHFVPNKTLMPVLEKLETHRVAFMAQVDTFVAGYPGFKEAMLAKYPDHQAALLPYYPDAASVRQKFGFNVTMFEVAFPREMKDINLASIQAEGEARKALQKKFEDEMQRQYAQSMVEVNAFLKDAISSTRGRVVEVFETVARKIQDREVISTSNLKTLSGIIETFDSLDFLDDSEVRKKLATVKSLITTGRDFKEDNDAIDALGAAVGAVLQVAKDTTDIDAITGEYVRHIEV